MEEKMNNNELKTSYDIAQIKEEIAILREAIELYKRVGEE